MSQALGNISAHVSSFWEKGGQDQRSARLAPALFSISQLPSSWVSLLQPPSQSSIALCAELILPYPPHRTVAEIGWTLESVISASTPCPRLLLHPGLFTMALLSSELEPVVIHLVFNGSMWGLLTGSAPQASTLAPEASIAAHPTHSPPSTPQHPWLSVLSPGDPPET